jgi:nickel/cobalt transporter (NicO) family protein
MMYDPIGLRKATWQAQQALCRGLTGVATTTFLLLMNTLIPSATALLLGSMHALELDHMAAVTAFTVRRPAALEAARFGLRWAVGHGTAVVCTGFTFLMIGAAIPSAMAARLENVVGAILILLGAWTAWHARRLHAHNGHARLHSHAFHRGHEYGRAATAIGVVHGLAGAAPVILLLQLADHQSVVEGVAYLFAFATGTAIGMALYALVTGYLVGRAAIASQNWARRLGQFAGMGTITIGLFWLLR